MQTKSGRQEITQGVQVFKKLALLSFLTGIILVAILWLDPNKERDLQHHINAAIIEKQALLKQTQGNKVILVAGSNFLYGIDSDSLEIALGRPVINMALPYYLGADFLLKQLEEMLLPGDIVVMGFEFMVSREGQMNEKVLTAQFYPPAQQWIEYPTWKTRISAPLTAQFLRIRKMISRSFAPAEKEPTVEDITNELFRSGLDSHGDLISQDNNPATGEMVIIPMNNEKDFLPVISCMDSVARKHPQVRFLYVHPTLSQSGYEVDQQVIARIQNEFSSSSHSFQIVNTLSDSIYPDSLFHNSPYHLTPAGRTLHTRRMAEWLKRTL